MYSLSFWWSDGHQDKKYMQFLNNIMLCVYSQFYQDYLFPDGDNH